LAANNVGRTTGLAEPGADWEGRLLRWSNAALEATVFYLLLAAWARPRDGSAAILPLLACLALPAGLAIRNLLDSATVTEAIRLLATGLAALAWAFTVARLSAPAGYWQPVAAGDDLSRGVLLLGTIFGGREGSGLQPLGFWASLLLWWRGQVLPAWEPNFEETLGRLRLGCLAVGAIVGLAARGDATGSGALVQLEQVLGVSAFLVAALLTTGLARRCEMAGGLSAAPALEAQPGARATGSRGGSLAPLLVITVALLTLGLAAWSADSVTPQALAPALALIGRALEMLSAGVAWFLGLLGGLLPASSTPAATEQPARAPSAQPDPLPPLAGAALAWFGPLLLLASLVGMVGLAALVYIAIRRALARDFEDESTAAEAPDDRGPLRVAPNRPVLLRALRTLVLLAGLLRALFNRSQAAAGPQPMAASEREAADPGLRSIRAVYRAYLAWAAEHGFARRPNETPDELGRRVALGFPGASLEAELLTRLYVAARYGGLSCPPSDLRRAEAALARLRSNV
jgi:hypothetical protein